MQMQLKSIQKHVTINLGKNGENNFKKILKPIIYLKPHIEDAHYITIVVLTLDIQRLYFEDSLRELTMYQVIPKVPSNRFPACLRLRHTSAYVCF